MVERSVAVYGGGVMGGLHIKTASGIEGVRIGAVIDPDNRRATDLADRFGDEHTIADSDMTDAQLSSMDMVVVASPSRFHFEQAARAMKMEKPVLIEKPVGESVEQAEKLAQLRQEMGVVAMAGHIELFNPAFLSTFGLIREQRIHEIDLQRLNVTPPDSRLYHDVVTDIMIHDFSIALELLSRTGNNASRAEILSAVGRYDTIAGPDPVRASVRFGDIDAHFHASRANPGGKTRAMRIRLDTQNVEVDLVKRSYRTESAHSPNPIDGLIEEDKKITNYYPSSSGEPLKGEWDHFLRCIDGNALPEDMGVSLEQAVSVIKLARGVLDVVRTHQPMTIELN